MTVKIRLPTLLRKHAENKSVITVNSGTLSEVFDSIANQYPDLGSQLRTGEGELHKFMNVYVNDDDVRFLQKLETPVGDGSTVTILPAVAGGSF